jgi:hypothetical protein
MRPLIDPRLRWDIPEIWPSKCTIQQITFTQTASNQDIQSGVTDVTGMKNIPCLMAPLIELRPTDDESRIAQIEDRNQRRQIKLNGYFPTIVSRTMQAVVDGKIWPIRGVEHDSLHFSTRLKVEIVTP